MKVNSLLLVYLIHLFNNIFCDISLDSEYEPYLTAYQASIHQIKMVSCLNLVEAAIKQTNGYKDLLTLMETTKLDKSKLYIKYIMGMMVNCVNKIKNEQIDYLITPENADNYNLKNESITNLIKINGNLIKTTELTAEENEYYNEINKNVKKTEKNKKEKGFFEKNIYYIGGGFILFTLILSTTLFKDFKPKKREDKATEEIVNLLKQKGKKAHEAKEKYKKEQEEKEKKEKEEKDKPKKD
jgi:hypothetical protein